MVVSRCEPRHRRRVPLQRSRKTLLTTSPWVVYGGSSCVGESGALEECTLFFFLCFGRRKASHSEKCMSWCACFLGRRSFTKIRKMSLEEQKSPLGNPDLVSLKVLCADWKFCLNKEALQEAAAANLEHCQGCHHSRRSRSCSIPSSASCASSPLAPAFPLGRALPESSWILQASSKHYCQSNTHSITDPDRREAATMTHDACACRSKFS